MLRTGVKDFLIAQEQGAGELQVLLVSFLRRRAHTPSLPASFSCPFSSSMLGLLAAEGSFAKVRLRSRLLKVSSAFCVFFCYHVALTPRLCPSLSLLVSATVGGVERWWFAGRGTVRM